MSAAAWVLFSTPVPHPPTQAEGQKVGRYLRIMAAEGKEQQPQALSQYASLKEYEEISEDAMPEWLTLQRKKEAR